MSKKERRDWLLTLWDFHNGTLSAEEMQEVEDRIASDPKSRTDSERVSEVINELRQAGRWETHPEFPAQMISRIIAAEKGGKGKWLIAAAVVALLTVFFYFLKPERSSSPERTEKEQVEKTAVDLDVPVPGPKPLELGNRPGEKLLQPSEKVSGSLRLRDPVEKMESEMDRSIVSPLLIPPRD